MYLNGYDRYDKRIQEESPLIIVSSPRLVVFTEDKNGSWSIVEEGQSQ